MNATLAREDGLAVGDIIDLETIDAPVHLRIVGILAGDGPWAGGGGRAVIVPLETAQAAFAADGLTRVDIGTTSAAAVTDALESTLLSEPYVLSSPHDIGASMRASTGDFAATTALIGAIALFAGAFLIFNTLSMTVVERVRELGLLRAAGASRGQLTSYILVQATAIGIVGSLLGVVARRGSRGGHRRLGADRRLGGAGRSGRDRQRRPRGARHRHRRDARGRDRAGAPSRSHLAGRGAQGSPGPADRAPSAAALAHRRVRARRRRGPAHPAARGR